MGNLAEAAESLQQAVRANPGFIPAHYELGVVLVELEKYEDAIARFERLISIDPRFPKAYMALAALYKEKGDPVRSNHYFEMYQQFGRSGR